MADLKTLFPEASDLETAILRNSDLLVSLGVPQDVATRAARRVIPDLRKAIAPIDGYGDIPNFTEKHLTTALFIGGLCNWSEGMGPQTTISMQAILELYRRGA